MRRRWWLLSLATLAALAGSGGVRAQEAATLSIDPPSQNVTPGAALFEVRLMVKGVSSEQGVGGYTLVMSYDPSVAEARTVTDSGFIASTDNTVLCPSSAIDNDAGRLAHFCFTVPVFAAPGPKAVEPQVLARISFEPVGEGETALRIGETTLIDPEGNDIDVTTVDGEVTVGARSQTQAAPTEAATEENDGSGGRTGLYWGLGAAGLVTVAVGVGALAVWSRRRGARA